MIFADGVLARRIEAAEAAIRRGCTEGQPGAAVLEAGGGVALFLGPESPLTRAVGVGLNGPVRESELDRIEAFFRGRGARVAIELCPLADPGLLASLAERGYRPTEFDNVLVKPLTGEEKWSAQATERGCWRQSRSLLYFKLTHLRRRRPVPPAVFGTRD